MSTKIVSLPLTLLLCRSTSNPNSNPSDPPESPVVAAAARAVAKVKAERANGGGGAAVAPTQMHDMAQQSQLGQMALRVDEHDEQESPLPLVEKLVEHLASVSAGGAPPSVENVEVSA